MDISAEHVRTGVTEPAVHVAQHTTHMQQQSPVSTQCNMFLAGYMDCVQEAIWYLTEVEKLPLDHPLVLSLKMNLYEQYRTLQLQHMLRTNLRVCNEGEINQIKIEPQDATEAQNVIGNDANRGVEKCAIQTEHVIKSEPDVQKHSFSDGTENVPKNVAKLSSDVEENASSATEDSGLSPEAHRMAVALAEEIFSLLQGQDDIDVTDDEEEIIDEGFEEMIEL